MSVVELHQLRYFVAVAEQRHFTKAARALRIAQPSVSRAIRVLADVRRGRLAVGATPSLATTLVPAALARFHHTYPGIDLALFEAGSRDLVSQLEQGQLDVALVILPVRHEILEMTPLLREELVVAVAPDHPLASRKTIGIADLKGVPLV